ncbi:hypothetical protein HYALB_00007151 [Hymenoscyphus albidus]|uniref:Uncharacterized protein n=1 Tax=Hymenoscyphus albidus TaxID=595503 RepID=A0A9N9LE27_9HELO|nr:hypothetical protein HYALB_00007151 [Hymenoscyphus albidus]
MSVFCLNLLDRHVLPDQMIAHLSTGSHFKTYESERTASFSTNCNVLNMLVNSPQPLKYLDSIAEAAKYNLSPYYSMMLMDQALTGLLRLSGFQIATSSLSVAILLEKTPKLLTQIPEKAAYGVLTLMALQDFPWMNKLKTQVQRSIGKGRGFLGVSGPKWAHAQYLWVEKVTYGSPILSMSYCLAAMYTKKEESCWGKCASFTTMAVDEQAILDIVHFQYRLPGLSNEPQWNIEAALTESYFILPELRNSRLVMFPRHEQIRILITNSCAHPMAKGQKDTPWTADNRIGGRDCGSKADEAPRPSP